MYLRKIKRLQGIYLAIQESYYDSTSKQSRTRTVESLGCLDSLKKEYDDPIAYFTNKAAEMTKEKRRSRSYIFTIDATEKMTTDTNDVKNVGYGVLKELYKQLEIDRFWNWKTRNLSIRYSVDQIFRLLVFSRILAPASKKGTFEDRNFYFEDFGDFSLDDVCHALDVICANYYFDIGRSDMDILDDEGNPVDKNGNPAPVKYRKRGPEKNHRPDPIVEMGLLMDRKEIPLAFDLFPGNESEKVHMRPVINRIKNEFSDSRIIFVADRGLNTSDNIYYLNGDNKGDINTRDGYVYGQSVRGADAAFKAWVLSGDYVTDKAMDDDGTEITFKHKSRIHPKELHVNVTKPDQKKKSKKTVSIDQKQMVYYSEKYAKKQRTDRKVMIQRAKDLIKHPKKYDGYYSIVTSELKMSDIEMREIYRGLIRIEGTFKISKSEFDSRPVFVRTNNHIDAHFTTCFTALVLIRILQAKLEILQGLNDDFRGFFIRIYIGKHSAEFLSNKYGIYKRSRKSKIPGISY